MDQLPNLILPIASALVGAAVAGYASFLAGRGVRSHDWKLSRIREKLLDCRQLYARFLAEADRFTILSTDKAATSIESLAPLFALFSELSLVASESVSNSAAKICETALNSLSAEPDAAGSYFKAKSEFLKAAREEISALETSAGRRG